jgi:hypothetical protein
LITGYFYAVDTEPDLKILDALHNYAVERVVDKHKANIIQIAWTGHGTIDFQLINNDCHALFNFKEKAGCCRNAFPANVNGWAKTKERKLRNELLKKYSTKKPFFYFLQPLTSFNNSPCLKVVK